MSNNKNRISQLGLVGIALMGFGLNACLSDDSDKDSNADTAGKGSGASGGTGGSGGAGASTGAAGSGGGGTVPGAVCASPIKLTTDKAAIANFDDYDGAADLTKWSFALGADSSTGVFSGPFAYGDHEGAPEAFEMVDGNESTYGLSISDSESTEYGGGLGLWMSECLDASAFSGISFWARGKAPTGTVKLFLMMQETQSSMPDKEDTKKGTCSATQDKCIHPIAEVKVTDTWTEVKVPWSQFMLGSAAGNPVQADGTNVWQLQVEVPLEWKADDAGEYHPTPSDYELVIDSVAFY